VQADVTGTVVLVDVSTGTFTSSDVAIGTATGLGLTTTPTSFGCNSLVTIAETVQGNQVGGKFKLAFCSHGGVCDSSSYIDFDSSAAAVQTALNNLSSIVTANGGVTVQQADGDYLGPSKGRKWLVTFGGTSEGGDVTMLYVPSVCDVNDSAGSGTDLCDFLTAPHGGVSVFVTETTKGNELSGSFKLSYGGLSTANIPFSASASTLRAELMQLATVGVVQVSEPTITNVQGQVKAKIWNVTFAPTGDKNQYQENCNAATEALMWDAPNEPYSRCWGQNVGNVPLMACDKTGLYTNNGSQDCTVVTLRHGNEPVSGVFKVTFDTRTCLTCGIKRLVESGPISTRAPANIADGEGSVQEVLQAMSNVGKVNVVRSPVDVDTGGFTWAVTFLRDAYTSTCSDPDSDMTCLSPGNVPLLAVTGTTSPCVQTVSFTCSTHNGDQSTCDAQDGCVFSTYFPCTTYDSDAGSCGAQAGCMHTGSACVNACEDACVLAPTADGGAGCSAIAGCMFTNADLGREGLIGTQADFLITEQIVGNTVSGSFALELAGQTLGAWTTSTGDARIGMRWDTTSAELKHALESKMTNEIGSVMVSRSRFDKYGAYVWQVTYVKNKCGSGGAATCTDGFRSPYGAGDMTELSPSAVELGDGDSSNVCDKRCDPTKECCGNGYLDSNACTCLSGWTATSHGTCAPAAQVCSTVEDPTGANCLEVDHCRFNAEEVAGAGAAFDVTVGANGAVQMAVSAVGTGYGNVGNKIVFTDAAGACVTLPVASYTASGGSVTAVHFSNHGDCSAAPTAAAATAASCTPMPETCADVASPTAGNCLSSNHCTFTPTCECCIFSVAPSGSCGVLTGTTQTAAPSAVLVNRAGSSQYDTYLNIFGISSVPTYNEAPEVTPNTVIEGSKALNGYFRVDMASGLGPYLVKYNESELHMKQALESLTTVGTVHVTRSQLGYGWASQYVNGKKGGYRWEVVFVNNPGQGSLVAFPPGTRDIAPIMVSGTAVNIADTTPVIEHMAAVGSWCSKIVCGENVDVDTTEVFAGSSELIGNAKLAYNEVETPSMAMASLTGPSLKSSLEALGTIGSVSVVESMHLGRALPGSVSIGMMDQVAVFSFPGDTYVALADEGRCKGAQITPEATIYRPRNAFAAAADLEATNLTACQARCDQSAGCVGVSWHAGNSSCLPTFDYFDPSSVDVDSGFQCFRKHFGDDARKYVDHGALIRIGGGASLADSSAAGSNGDVHLGTVSVQNGSPVLQLKGTLIDPLYRGQSVRIDGDEYTIAHTGYSQLSVQITTTTALTAGTFQLSYGGVKTSCLAFNSSAEEMQTAINSIFSSCATTETGNDDKEKACRLHVGACDNTSNPTEATCGGTWTPASAGVYADQAANCVGDTANSCKWTDQVVRVVRQTHWTASKVNNAGDAATFLDRMGMTTNMQPMYTWYVNFSGTGFSSAAATALEATLNDADACGSGGLWAPALSNVSGNSSDEVVVNVATTDRFAANPTLTTKYAGPTQQSVSMFTVAPVFRVAEDARMKVQVIFTVTDIGATCPGGTCGEGQLTYTGTDGTSRSECIAWNAAAHDVESKLIDKWSADADPAWKDLTVTRVSQGDNFIFTIVFPANIGRANASGVVTTTANIVSVSNSGCASALTTSRVTVASTVISQGYDTTPRAPAFACVGGDATTVTLAGTASSADDYYNGSTISFNSGPGAGQATTISAYNGSTKIANMSTVTTPPTSSTYYSIGDDERDASTVYTSGLVIGPNYVRLVDKDGNNRFRTYMQKSSSSLTAYVVNGRRFEVQYDTNLGDIPAVSVIPESLSSGVTVNVVNDFVKGNLPNVFSAGSVTKGFQYALRVAAHNNEVGPYAGLALSGSSSTAVLPVGANTTDGFYNDIVFELLQRPADVNCVVAATSGDASVSYVSGDFFTTSFRIGDSVFTTSDGGTTYDLLGVVAQVESDVSMVLQIGATSTVSLAAYTTEENAVFESQYVTGYDGSTRTVSFGAMSTAVQAGDGFRIRTDYSAWAPSVTAMVAAAPSPPEHVAVYPAYHADEVQVVTTGAKHVDEVQVITTSARSINEVQMVTTASTNGAVDGEFLLQLTVTDADGNSVTVSTARMADDVSAADMKSAVDAVSSDAGVPVEVNVVRTMAGAASSNTFRWTITFMKPTANVAEMSCGGYFVNNGSHSCAVSTNIDGNFISGQFVLAYNSAQTISLPADASDNAVQSAFTDLGGVDDVAVTRSEADAQGGYSWSVTFTANDGNLNTIQAFPSLTGTDVQMVVTKPTTGNELGGSFTLRYGTHSTEPLMTNATELEVKDALEALDGVAELIVRRTGPDRDGGYSWTITFQDTNMPGDLPSLVADGTQLTGTGALVIVEELVKGSEANSVNLAVSYSPPGFVNGAVHAINGDGGSAVTAFKVEVDTSNSFDSANHMHYVISDPERLYRRQSVVTHSDSGLSVAGTFKLMYKGERTEPISATTSAHKLRMLLEALPTVTVAHTAKRFGMVPALAGAKWAVLGAGSQATSDTQFTVGASFGAGDIAVKEPVWINGEMFCVASTHVTNTPLSTLNLVACPSACVQLFTDSQSAAICDFDVATTDTAAQFLASGSSLTAYKWSGGYTWDVALMQAQTPLEMVSCRIAADSNVIDSNGVAAHVGVFGPPCEKCFYIPDLQMGTEAYVRVWAKNHMGYNNIPSMAWSNSATYSDRTKPREVPGHPQQATLHSHSSTTLLAEWFPPASDGGDAITSYVVQWDTDQSFGIASFWAGSWELIEHGTGCGTGGAAGLLKDSASCAATVGWTNGDTSCVGDGCVSTVGWTCKAYSRTDLPNGPWCSDYKVIHAAKAGHAHNFPENNCEICGAGHPVGEATVDGSAIQVTGQKISYVIGEGGMQLDSDLTYFVRIAAQNSVPIQRVSPNYNPPSNMNWEEMAPTSMQPVNTVPQPPTQVVAKRLDSTSMRVLVMAPLHTGGVAISKFKVEYDVVNTFDSGHMKTSVQEVANLVQLYAQGFWVISVPGLTTGQNYSVRVSAYNGVDEVSGVGGYSTPTVASTMVRPSRAPAPPSNGALSALRVQTAAPITDFTANWSTPAAENGSPVNGYKLEWWTGAQVREVQHIRLGCTHTDNLRGKVLIEWSGRTVQVDANATATLMRKQLMLTLGTGHVDVTRSPWADDVYQYGYQWSITFAEPGNRLPLVVPAHNTGGQPNLLAGVCANDGTISCQDTSACSGGNACNFPGSCTDNSNPCKEDADCSGLATCANLPAYQSVVEEVVSGRRPQGTPEVQIITATDAGTLSGFYRLRFAGSSFTTYIAHDADGTRLSQALEDLSTVGTINAVRTTSTASTTVWAVTFLSNRGNVPKLDVDGTYLSGTITVQDGDNSVVEGGVSLSAVACAACQVGELPGEWGEAEIPGTSLSHTVVGLVAGKTYYVRLMARNVDNGYGDFAAPTPSHVLLPLQVPGSPTAVALSTVTGSATKLKLSYNEPTSTGGSDILKYSVEWCAMSQGVTESTCFENPINSGVVLNSTGQELPPNSIGCPTSNIRQVHVVRVQKTTGGAVGGWFKLRMVRTGCVSGTPDMCIADEGAEVTAKIPFNAVAMEEDEAVLGSFQNTGSYDGTGSTVQLDSDASSETGVYVDWTLGVMPGNTQKVISAYNGTTKVATLNEPLGSSVDGDSSYVVTRPYCSQHAGCLAQPYPVGSMQAHLEALSTVSDGSVKVTRTLDGNDGFAWTITFLDNGSDFKLHLGTSNVDTEDATGLTNARVTTDVETTPTIPTTFNETPGASPCGEGDGCNAAYKSKDTVPAVTGRVFSQCEGHIVITGLTAGQLYKARIYAFNQSGFGLPGLSTTTLKPMVPPGVPTAVALTIQSASQLRISFDPPISDGGDVITEYVVEADTSSLFNTGVTKMYHGKDFSALHIGRVLNLAAGAPYIYTFDDLQMGTSYFMRVRAYNSEGYGMAQTSSPVSEAPKREPSAPAMVTVLITSDSKITVIITPPYDVGGEAVSQYQVKHDTQSNMQSEMAPPDKGAHVLEANANTRYTVSSLSYLLQYYVEVQAGNSMGYGRGTLGSSPITPRLMVPGKPDQITVATGAATGEITIAWSPPFIPAHGYACTGTEAVPGPCPSGMGRGTEADGGAGISQYEIAYDQLQSFNGAFGGTLIVAAVDAPGQAYTAVLENLSPGATYFIRIAAKNSIGLGAYCAKADDGNHHCTGGTLEAVAAS
jgi:hypothetical protein